MTYHASKYMNLWTCGSACTQFRCSIFYISVVETRVFHNDFIYFIFTDGLHVKTQMIFIRLHILHMISTVKPLISDQTQHLNVSRLVLQLSLPNPLKPGFENEDVVGAAQKGDAPTTSDWPTMLLHTNVRLILGVRWHALLCVLATRQICRSGISLDLVTG